MIAQNANTGFPSPPLDLQLFEENGEKAGFGLLDQSPSSSSSPVSSPRNLLSIFFGYVHPFHKEHDFIVFHFTGGETDFSYLPTTWP